MKKIVLLLICSIAFASNAQNMYPYAFTKSNEPYQDLVGATSLTNGVIWTDTSFTVPICFPFRWALGHRTVNSFELTNFGYLFASVDLDTNQGMIYRMMMPYYVYMCEKAYNANTAPQSNISYQCAGAYPNRILKIEYKNCGFAFNSSGQDFTNFQVWFYEGSNVIEYRYGPQMVSDFMMDFLFRSGPGINLIYQMNENNITQEIDYNECSYVAGNSATANAVFSTTPFPASNPPTNFYFDSIPTNGQVFRWTPAVNPNSINSTDDFNTIKVYPIPFNESINIENNNEIQYIRLNDLNGRVLIQENVRGNKAELNTKSLSNGVYFLTIIDAKGNQKTMKVVK